VGWMVVTGPLHNDERTGEERAAALCMHNHIAYLCEQRGKFSGDSKLGVALRSLPVCPLACGGLVPCTVRLVQMSNVRYKRVVRVRVSEHRADAQQDLRDGEGRRPLITKNVQADGAVVVDVRMVDLRRERHLRRLCNKC